jgi:hypothetical protein
MPGMQKRRLFIAVCCVVILSISLGIGWRRQLQLRHDRELVAVFVAAARQGQDLSPCGLEVETVAEVAKQAKVLPVPACVRPDATGQEAEWHFLVEQYWRVTKGYDGIADAVARFDVRRASAVSAATAGLSGIVDSELRGKAKEARAALERREQVTSTLLADWRNSSRAMTSYASRIEAGLLHGDKAACEALPQGVAAKSPAEIVVECQMNFDRSRSELDAKLAQLERVAHE